MAERKKNSNRKPRLRKGDLANFHTLLAAGSHGDLALVASIRKSDRRRVALVCAMSAVEGSDDIRPVPIAVMVEGNPYELFEDPTA